MSIEQQVLLARGEQVTLQMELEAKQAQFQAEKEGMVGLLNRLTPTGERGWLHVEIARLRRLDELQEELAALTARIRDLKKISGI